MQTPRNWTFVGIGLEVLAGVLVTVEPYLAIPVAIAGIFAIALGLFPEWIMRLVPKNVSDWAITNAEINKNKSTEQTQHDGQIEFIENERCRREDLRANDLITELYVAIRNAGKKTVETFEIRLLDIDDGESISRTAKRLGSDDGNEKQITLHSGDTAYFKLIEISRDRNSPIQLVQIISGPFDEDTTHIIGNGPYRIKIRASGKDTPTHHQFYEFEYKNFEEIIYGKSTAFSGRDERL